MINNDEELTHLATAVVVEARTWAASINVVARIKEMLRPHVLKGENTEAVQ